MLKGLTKQTDFKKNLAKMTFATIIAQAIALGSSPVLTRVFSPEQFGSFSLFIALVSVLSTFVSLRIEQAILLPKENSFAYNIFRVCIKISFWSSLILAILLIIGGDLFFNATGIQIQGTKWHLILAVGALSYALYFSTKTWANRTLCYFYIGAAKIIENLFSAIIPLILSLISISSFTLIYGKLAGTLCGAAFFSLSLKMRPNTIGEDQQTAFTIIKRYKNFPIYSVPAEMMSQLATYLPVFFLSSTYGVAAAGLFGLTIRVLTLPINFVATSFTDVFRQRAAVDYAAGSCRAIFVKMTFLLCAISIIPGLLLLFFGPFLFSLVFGSEWREAGVFAQMMSIMFIARLIASPLSYTLIIAEKQRTSFLCQLYILTTSVLVLITAKLFSINMKYTIAAWAINYTFYFIGLALLSYRATINRNQLSHERSQYLA